MPNPLGIFVNLSNAVKRDSMYPFFQVGELECLRAVRGKGDFLQRHQDDAILGPIVVSQLEFSLGELGIPPDAVEKFVNGNHF